jgi:hypothetical protein
MKKTALIFIILTASLLGSLRSAWAERDTPFIQIIVQDSKGQQLPLADKIRMRDASPTASDTGIRSPHKNSEGDIVFGPRDFEEFLITGNNENGKTQTSTFDGDVRLTDAHFDVELSLDADGYAPQKYSITVSADEPTSYIFVLADY